MVENDHLRDFQINTDKLVMANQPDIVVVYKQRKMAVVLEVAIISDSNIRKKEHEEDGSNSGTRNCPNRSTRGSYAQIGRVAPSDARNNI